MIGRLQCLTPQVRRSPGAKPFDGPFGAERLGARQLEAVSTS